MEIETSRPETLSTVKYFLSKYFCSTHRKLEIEFSAASFYFLWMIEPLHLAHHAPRARLPQHLNLANVGSVGATRGQEHRAVVHVQHVLAALN